MMVAFVAAVLVAFVFSGLTVTDVQHLGTPRNAIVDGGEEVRVPVPPASDGRVLPVVTSPSEGDYGFMFLDGAAPIRYDPCRPIEFVIAPSGGPLGGDDLIKEAFEQVSTASGLAFVFKGHTSEEASFERSLIQPDVYGENFAPVIVGWSDETVVADLAGAVTGLGGSSSVTGAYGPERFLTSGVVILDGPDILELLGTENSRQIALAVVMHELGHVVGLAHVDNELELMNASNTWLTAWGSGDLAGLAAAGAGPCQEV